ncbi:MAG: hypothetical protein ACK4PR_09420, partial [Gammaproteobacteria bacterium]
KKAAYFNGIKEKNLFIEIYRDVASNKIIGFSFFTISAYQKMPNLIQFIVGLIQITDEYRSCGLATLFYRIPLAMANSYPQLFFLIGAESAQPGWSYFLLPRSLDFFPKYYYPPELIEDMM